MLIIAALETQFAGMTFIYVQITHVHIIVYWWYWHLLTMAVYHPSMDPFMDRWIDLYIYSIYASYMNAHNNGGCQTCLYNPPKDIKDGWLDNVGCCSWKSLRLWFHGYPISHSHLHCHPGKGSQAAPTAPSKPVASRQLRRASQP